MSCLKMRWPTLDLEVRCHGLAENPEAFQLLLENLPIKVVQGHEMTGGWLLRDYAVPLTQKPFTLPVESLQSETMCKAPVGRVSLLRPRGSLTELLVKYDACVDTREYVPVAQVEAEDLAILKEAGQKQWAASTRSKAIVLVELTAEED